MNHLEIRPIMPSDNALLATIIRSSLEEFGANNPGTVYYDESTNHLSDVFAAPSSAYFVATMDNNILGGAGIYPTQGLPKHTCELVKMYLKKDARGLGIGKKLMQQCLQAASSKDFDAVYLETMPQLTLAIPMYIQFGFKMIEQPMGNSGHHGCGIWMLKKL